MGKDGRLLAVIEAKRSTKDPNIGRKQVQLKSMTRSPTTITRKTQSGRYIILYLMMDRSNQYGNGKVATIELFSR